MWPYRKAASWDNFINMKYLISELNPKGISNAHFCTLSHSDYASLSDQCPVLSAFLSQRSAQTATLSLPGMSQGTRQ